MARPKRNPKTVSLNNLILKQLKILMWQHILTKLDDIICEGSSDLGFSKIVQIRYFQHT